MAYMGSERSLALVDAESLAAARNAAGLPTRVTETQHLIDVAYQYLDEIAAGRLSPGQAKALTQYLELMFTMVQSKENPMAGSDFFQINAESVKVGKQ